MKRRITSICCTLAVVIFGHFELFAQTTASATASSTATIVSPVGVDNATNMVFGNIAVSSAAGTAVLSATPTSVITVNGGASVATAPVVSTSTAAAVNVSGSAAYTYAVNVAPATVALSDGKGNSVSLAPQLSSNVGSLDKDGKGTVYLGGTLTVMANQPTGAYNENQGIYLTLNYN